MAGATATGHVSRGGAMGMVDKQQIKDGWVPNETGIEMGISSINGNIIYKWAENAENGLISYCMMLSDYDHLIAIDPSNLFVRCLSARPPCFGAHNQNAKKNLGR